MIRINCPSCGRKLRVDESTPAAQCPACRTKFKVAVGETKLATVPTRGISERRPLAESESPPKRTSEPTKSVPQEIEEAEVIEAEPVEEPEELSSPNSVPRARSETEPTEPPRTDDAHEDREDIPRRRKKKRKKPRESYSPAGGRGPNVNLLVAGALLCVGLAVVGAFVLFKLFGSAGSNKASPEAQEKAIAELGKLGVLLERDNSSPDRPVIGINAAETDLFGKNAVYLEAFPKLRKLDVSRTKFNNIDLLHLEGLTELRELNLGSTKVGDDIEPLSKLVNLETLNLANTLVRDTGLHHLRGLTKLKRLSVGGSLASGLELQGTIPGLQVFR
jgi:Leucine-rich repeat (LRR) protein